MLRSQRQVDEMPSPLELGIFDQFRDPNHQSHLHMLLQSPISRRYSGILVDAFRIQDTLFDRFLQTVLLQTTAEGYQDHQQVPVQLPSSSLVPS